jgi:hypothetical protein
MADPDRSEHDAAWLHSRRRVDWTRIADAILVYVETVRSNLTATRDTPRAPEPSPAAFPYDDETDRRD